MMDKIYVKISVNKFYIFIGALYKLTVKRR